MYITEILTKTKDGKTSHRCILLRESYREKGKVKNRTIANITHLKQNEIEALRLALKYKDNLAALESLEEIEIRQGKSVGAVYLVNEIAKDLGIHKALGKSRQAQLALWQILSRVIDQGSRLSSVRMAHLHATSDVLKMTQGFNEDDLYKNLAWLADHQDAIEKCLFKARYQEKEPSLFLYDVTSSYLEGVDNELANWGYNRDKKAGKKQLVVGLLCDEWGNPVSVKVFEGNTHDTATFSDQIQKVTKQFNCDKVVFVGDRGMIKSGQIKELADATETLYYITAITKPQIEKFLKEDVFQMEFFDVELCEIEHESIRYILKRNPKRAQEIAQKRQEKKESLETFCQKRNNYLSQHPRAKFITALKKIQNRIKQLKIDAWLKVETKDRTFTLSVHNESLQETAKLDGCYVVKSDLPKDINKQVIHDRYKDLAKVEKAFRTCKISFLEMRPWFVRTEKSTRGHALVLMLAYIIVLYLQKKWEAFDMTVEEGLEHLTTLCSMEIRLHGKNTCHRIPNPSSISRQLLQAAEVKLPRIIPKLGAHVDSRKKLAEERKQAV